ncbi:MAG: mannose-1-phosphate guanylyltransferase, partial [Polyangia bacterium]
RLMEAVRTHLPELGEILHAIEKRPADVVTLYPQAPSVSIDYGVMEKLPRGDVFCVPGDFGWNDVGSWSALGELRPHDDADNVSTGNTITIDARSNILYSDGKRVIAAVGVEDLVIVATDDAVLVMPKSKAQQVRDVVKALETTNRKEFL